MKQLVLTDGRKLEITGEDGKYWVCGERRFRKLSPAICEVRDAQEKKPAPKKKTAAKKKEATEVASDGDNGE